MPMEIRSVIVEDEAAARAALGAYLSKYCPQVRVLGEAANIREAVPLIERERPQLVFLDVEMPYGNAFDVLEACAHIPFETIFVTAFSEYAIQALNRSAAYYLLKPVSIEELILAVNRVQAHLQTREVFDKNKVIVENFREPQVQRQQIVLPTLEGFEVVRMDQIIRLRGNGNFTDIHLADGSKKMVCRFLKHFAELLPPRFLRVHKSHIINLDYVKGYHKGSGGFIALSDGSEVELSAAYKEVFLEYFK